MNTILEKLAQIQKHTGESKENTLAKEIELTLRQNIHLCNFCILSPNTCKGEILERGYGVGKDNVVSCQTFKQENLQFIDIKFYNIDFWGRPVYKIQGKDIYIGSVETIFPDTTIAPNCTTEEINDYFKNNLKELVIFGSTFDEHDPLGTNLKKNIRLNII